MSEDALFPRDSDPVAQQIAAARWVLRQMNFDAERSNERSALVLLALLGLTPDSMWEEARNPLMRTVEIMDWLREHYHKDYKPNTRETIRRFTLHQFADAMLVEQNPDQPDRPVNSPKWCYRIQATALPVMRSVGEAAFAEHLRLYLVEVPGLRATYARARDLHRIPVTLPDGSAVTLSPGGQNTLPHPTGQSTRRGTGNSPTCSEDRPPGWSTSPASPPGRK